jgi:hypothetical protein
MGISWGGYHTAAVAGVDRRLSAAVIVYGCGELYKNSVWTREGEKFSESYKYQLDPANFLPKSKIPILWLNNNTDHFFPLDSHQSSRKLTAGKSYARIKDNYSHGYETPWKTEDIHLFADAFLKGRRIWPEISSTELSHNMIRVKAKNINRLNKAWLVYTNDSDWMHKSVRTDGNEIWIEKEVGLENRKMVKTEIPENAKAVYLHMKDDQGREFSTDYFVPKEPKQSKIKGGV